MTRPLWSFVAGVLVGTAVVALLALTATDEEKRQEAGAAPEFLADWTRSQNEEWFVRATVTRRTSEGKFEEQYVNVQRPPDSLRIVPGSIELKENGKYYICPTEIGENPVCRVRSIKEKWEATTAQQARILRTLVIGEARIYSVRQLAGGCYRLRLIKQVQLPLYGQAAKLCFDSKSYAPTLIEVDLGNRVFDITKAVEVRAKVNDTDFSFPNKAAMLSSAQN